ncbi:MAG: CHAT domain-containing protein [Pegethrix bostrychoides GSE-TBD4-15B]|uniref:CHAT domain-containing protein n=1 Tax=Pegethrix bostrychoides GSE-TBD4-15B TaxID=2839662 RepID=A0A951U4B7_9CYAN|nr:CHAT domain-containing protein [Pegethrix bostrychoides GSE-TBD4-15B]
MHNTESVEVKVFRPDGAEDYSGAVPFQYGTEFNLASLTDSSAIRQAGERLFKALLKDEKTFLKAYQTAGDAGKPLRVVLEINEALSEEFAKPWEFICVPNCPPNPVIWLATASGLSFSRRLYNPDLSQLKKIKLGEPLKVVLMVSRPTSEVGWFNSEQVESDLQAFAKQKQIDLIRASSKNLRDTLRDHKPQVFHFMGHGRLQDGAGQLAFMIESGPNFGRPDWKTAEEVVGLFPNDALPQVVILQACEGAKQSESDAFASLASKLLLQGIPIVVAMQYEIPAGIANQFVCRLYEEIVVRRNPVDAAVQEARNAIAQGHQKPDFATPVVYMNVADSQLFSETMTGNSVAEPIDLNHALPPGSPDRLNVIAAIASSSKFRDVGTRRAFFSNSALAEYADSFDLSGSSEEFAERILPALLGIGKLDVFLSWLLSTDKFLPQSKQVFLKSLLGTK